MERRIRNVAAVRSRFVAHRIRKFLTWKGYNAKLISSAEVRVKYFPQFASPPPEFFNDSLPEVSVTLPFSRIV